MSPVWVRRRTPASPGVCADSTSSSAAAALANASGSRAVAITSRSLTLSVHRRAEPASSTTLGRWVLAQRRDQLLAHDQRLVEDDPARAAAVALGGLGLGSGRRGQDALLGLGPEALQRADLLRLGGGDQRLERVDRQLLVEPPGALGSEPGSRVISSSPAGNLARSLAAAGITPSSASAITFSWMIDPDPGQLGGAALVARARVTDTGASRTALAALR